MPRLLASDWLRLELPAVPAVGDQVRTLDDLENELPPLIVSVCSHGQMHPVAGEAGYYLRRSHGVPPLIFVRDSESDKYVAGAMFHMLPLVRWIN